MQSPRPISNFHLLPKDRPAWLATTLTPNRSQQQVPPGTNLLLFFPADSMQPCNWFFHFDYSGLFSFSDYTTAAASPLGDGKVKGPGRALWCMVGAHATLAAFVFDYPGDQLRLQNGKKRKKKRKKRKKKAPS